MEGSTFIDGLDQELNFEAIFQSLTVEKTNAAKRTRKSRSQTEAALKSVVFITNQTHGDLYEVWRACLLTAPPPSRGTAGQGRAGFSEGLCFLIKKILLDSFR